MDISLFYQSWGGLMSTMNVIDPETGLPTLDHVRAYDSAPLAISETDMPVWIMFTGPAAYPAPPDQSLDRLAHEFPEFTASLYVCIAQAGTDGEAERRVRPYIETARDLIQKNIQLWDGDPNHRVPGLQRAYLLRRSAPGVLRYGQNNPTLYLGISYTVRLDVLNEVIYANNQ